MSYLYLKDIIIIENLTNVGKPRFPLRPLPFQGTYGSLGQTLPLQGTQGFPYDPFLSREPTVPLDEPSLCREPKVSPTTPSFFLNYNI